MLKNIRDNIVEYVVVVILLGGLIFSVTTSYKNSIILEEVSELKQGLKGVKQALISMMIKENIDSKEIEKLITTFPGPEPDEYTEPEERKITPPPPVEAYTE